MKTGRASCKRVRGVSLGRLQMSLSSSEGAVPWRRLVDQSLLACRDQPDSKDLCRDGAFVSHIVYVGAASIDKRHSSCVWDLRCLCLAWRQICLFIACAISEATNDFSH